MTAFGVWAIPTAVVLIIGYGLMRGVRVFEVFLEGAKEGLEMSWRILPALVALVVAVGMFKASGGLDLLSFALCRAAARWSFLQICSRHMVRTA